MPAPLHKNLHASCFSETKKGFPACFLTLCNKRVSTENTDFSSLCKNFYVDLIFVKQWMVLPRKLLHCEKKKPSTKNSDIPFICIKFFPTRILLKFWRVPQRNFSALWVYKIIQQKLVISPSWAENFFDTRIFLTQWMVPPQKFQHCETKKSSTPKSDIPFLRKKFVDTRLCLKRWIVTPRNYLALSDFKEAQRKVVMSNSYAWKFSIPEVSWSIEQYSRKISGTTRQKISKKTGTTLIYYP